MCLKTTARKSILYLKMLKSQQLGKSTDTEKGLEKDTEDDKATSESFHVGGRREGKQKKSFFGNSTQVSKEARGNI